jgi:hypothetical protein
MRAPLAPPDLGEEDVAFNAKRGEILLEGPHPLAHAGHPPRQLGIIERAQVIGHGKTLNLMLGTAIPESGEKGEVVDDLQEPAREKRQRESRGSDGEPGKGSAE